MGRVRRGATWIGRLLGRGSKGGDELAQVTGALGDATKSLDALTDVNQLGDAGNFLVKKRPSDDWIKKNPTHGCSKNPDECLEVKSGYRVLGSNDELIAGGGKSKFVKWEQGMKLDITAGHRAGLITKLDDATKASRAKNMLEPKSIWKPNAMRNLKVGAMFGGFGWLGYIFYRGIGVIGTLSDGLENAINDTYGVSCEENYANDPGGLEKCRERGSRNLVLTGVAVAAVVGLVVISLTKGKSKIKSSDAA